MEWPNGKKFAFTIIDDTDNSTIANIKPVYDLLYNCGMRTTKSVWVYPPRDNFRGGYLLDAEYLKYIQNLKKQGFEICLHNVGSGTFCRDEIADGLELYRQLIGSYPEIQINHANNEDNIYWGYKRFAPPIQILYRLFCGYRQRFFGDSLLSRFFWGDLCKKHIKYIRNHVFNGINTLKYDNKMPYRIEDKMKNSNYWFSSSDAHTAEEFCDLLNPLNLKKLREEKGCCIVYTHFAFGHVKNGIVRKGVEERIRFISRLGGWFVPAGRILNYLSAIHNSEETAHYAYRLKLDLLWLFDRIEKKIKYGR